MAAQPGTTVAAGRRIRPQDPAPRPVLAVGRGTAAAVGAVLCTLSVWSAGSAWYLLAREDIAAALLAKQAQIQEAYEDRLGLMRARLDRVASQKLLEQDSLEGRLAGLVSRQVQIETRQAMLSSLAEGIAGPAAPALKAPAPPLPATASAFAPVKPVPAPEPDPFQLRLRPAGAEAAPPPGPRAALTGGAPGSGTRIASVDGLPGSNPRAAPTDGAPAPDPRAAPVGGLPAALLPGDAPDARPGARMAAVERSLARVEAMQLRGLEVQLGGVRERAARLRAAIARLGLDPDTVKATAPGGIGGPLLPVPVDPRAGPFEALVGEVQSTLVTLDRLRRVTAALPLARPVAGDLDLTSGFGVRVDPFTRSPALHAGLDFRAEPGAPVRATGAGRVALAEPSGGYGNLVEIDHGNGIATRYAHLSAIGVIPGQSVAAGAVIGRVGSTGRSTGPHLHYETRIADEPVDPQRFLRAGAAIFAAGEP